jgi:hypothetical protein
LLTHAYHNNLVNWPRGNNGFAEAGGGWPGTLVWSGNLRPVARGNIVHMNGGEGIISYGSIPNRVTGSALFEQNVAFDNWSVNMYFDNQPNNVARNNLLFNRPSRPEHFLYTKGYPYDTLDKYSVCLMLANEEGSGDTTNGFASLDKTLVYNNLIIGCRIGIRDYSEGKQATKRHGLRNTKIVNNTIIMPAQKYAGGSVYGIYLQDNKTPSGEQRNFNSFIQNNIIYGFNSDPLISSPKIGALEGITLSHNLYFNENESISGAAQSWIRNSYLGFRNLDPRSMDKEGIFKDPRFVDVRYLRTLDKVLIPDIAKAKLAKESPALGRGIAQTFQPSVNFSLEDRVNWNIGAF